MERGTALKLFGKYFLGPDEINSVQDQMNVKCDIYNDIPFADDLLYKYKDTHILLFGMSKDKNGNDLNILNLRFYKDPLFYNQDWYLKEDFVKKTLNEKWYLIRRKLIDDTRGNLPKEEHKLPSAILVTYTFFLNYFVNKEILWENEYIWNSDFDHNGDRIYCGRYIDPEKMNKNGFNIHRHLTIKNNYGQIDTL